MATFQVGSALVGQNRRWSEFCGPIKFRIHKIHPGELRSHPAASSGPMSVPCSVGSLASAPNFRLRIVRLARYGAAKLCSKGFWSNHIVLVRMRRYVFGPSTAIPPHVHPIETNLKHSWARQSNPKGLAAATSFGGSEMTCTSVRRKSRRPGSCTY
jgi:hypothetical protein